MSLTDPIGDMIARIKNAQMRNHKKVDLPSSNFKTKIAEILKSEGFIIDYKVDDDVSKEIISIIGKQYETDHFKLISKDTSLPDDKRLNFDIWLDKKTSVIVKVTYKRMGNWEYRLKNLK